MSDKKEVKTKKVDVDVDKNYDLDLDAHIDIDKDVDVNIDKSNTNIDVWAEGKAHAYIEKVDVDINKSHTHEYKDIYEYRKDVDIDKDINISKENWDVNVTVNSDNIIQGSDVNEWQDNDVNDIDNQELIDVDDWGYVDMDDFTSDQLAIGDSFNGKGNDSQYSVNQSNNLDDSDTVHGTKVEYNSHAPKYIDTSVHIKNDADADAVAKAGAIGIGKAGDGGDGGDGGNGGHSHYYKTQGGQGGNGGNGGDGYGIAGAAAGAVALNKSSIDDNYIDTSIDTGDGAFQDVSAKGGSATSGDGIGKAEGWGLASDNEGDGTISGDSSASAAGVASAEAFTANVLAGGNQQANFATLNVVGGDMVDGGDGVYPAGSGHKGGHDGKDDHGGSESGGVLDAEGGLAIKDSWVNSDLDNDVNDLDSSELINVSEDGILHMDDFDLDVTAIGGSFNGSGNDMQFSFDQTNDLVDDDYVHGTTATYNGSFLDGPFQEVSAHGGTGMSGDGIGHVNADQGAYGNGGDGTIAGSTAASGDALATAQAFTANVVVGANVQVNNVSATIVGGNSSEIDDLGGV